MTTEVSRGEALQRVMEEGPGAAALKAGGRVLSHSSDPYLKGKKLSEIPFVCLQFLFPGFCQGCSFPEGEQFFC